MYIVQGRTKWHVDSINLFCTFMCLRKLCGTKILKEIEYHLINLLGEKHWHVADAFFFYQSMIL
ncbi:hypothetical protein [Marinilactibacillus psychrotolerans]|uniref:hypothetical protein n=1 Tax=Marinilactibacillus psychrotolerans TaxID=191770 RepID=UPI00115FE1DC|nr:hypothetical protein [Marinilactibacillus psychrotolerans]